MTSVFVNDINHWTLGIAVAILLGQIALDGGMLLLLMRGWEDVAASAKRTEQAVELLARIDTMVAESEKRDAQAVELLARIETMVSASEERDALMEQLLMDTEHYARSHRHAIHHLAGALSLRSVVTEYPALAEAAELHGVQDGDGHGSSA